MLRSPGDFHPTISEVRHLLHFVGSGFSQILLSTCSRVLNLFYSISWRLKRSQIGTSRENVPVRLKGLWRAIDLLAALVHALYLLLALHIAFRPGQHLQACRRDGFSTLQA